MRSKHNKKRNSAFLYEVLIRELTNSIISGDIKKKGVVLETIKTFFRKGTALGKELELFKTLCDSTELDSKTAEQILAETKEQHKKIDKNRLFSEQSSLISRINKKINPAVLQNFVPSYRNIATVYQIFNGGGSPKSRVMLENRILTSMTTPGDPTEQQVPISNLAFKTFISKFNSTYSGGLLEEQQRLLGSYVTSFSDNGLEFKVYLEEELGRIKDVLNKSLDMQEIKEDNDMLVKTRHVIALVESFSKSPLSEEMLENVLRIQELIKEME